MLKTGINIKTKRIKNGIKGYELAEEMGVNGARLSQIEAMAQVPEKSFIRCLEALNKIIAEKKHEEKLQKTI